MLAERLKCLHDQPSAEDVEQVFNALFAECLNTVLIGGAAEPFYQPADMQCSQHRIFYRENFVSSSLHEVAHWMVAGEARRLLPDWGYWYAPDGRNTAQQQAFERVEVAPQALEWLLHIACGLQFRVSLDNLSDAAGNGASFKEEVYKRACRFVIDGVHQRMQSFYDALAKYCGVNVSLSNVVLMRADLD